MSGDRIANGHDSDSAGPERAPDSAARQIMLSLAVVAVCWAFVKFGSLIVTIAISHTWAPDDPIVSAYTFLFRQLIMTFIYPSVLKIFRPAFIPLHNQIRTREGPQAAAAFAQGVMEIGMVLGLLLCGWLWLFPDLTVRSMAPDFTPAQKAAAVRMLQQMGPGVLCLLAAEMCLIVFHAGKVFSYPHGAEAVFKIGWGVGIVVAARLLGWRGAAIGVTYTVACAAQLGVSIYGMKRAFGWVVPRTGLRTWCRTWGRRAAFLVLPLVVGILAARCRDLVNLRLQSHLEIARFNGVEFARQLTNVPLVFLGQIVSIVMLPHLAAILHSNGAASHRRTLETTIETMWILSIPVVAASLVLAPELVALVFLKPPSEWTLAHYVLHTQGALAVRMIALGYTFMVLENILMPGLFSIQSMWWPILWGVAASAFQIACLLGLAALRLPPDSAWLVAGIAFAYPLSRILKNGILLLVLRRKTGLFPGRAFAVLLTRMLLFLGVALALTALARTLVALAPGSVTADDASLLRYKLVLGLKVLIPTGAMAAGLTAALLYAGYGQQLKELWQALRQRQGRSRPDV